MSEPTVTQTTRTTTTRVWPAGFKFRWVNAYGEGRGFHTPEEALAEGVAVARNIETTTREAGGLI